MDKNIVDQPASDDQSHYIQALSQTTQKSLKSLETITNTEGYQMISGNFNHQRWQYIMSVYQKMLSDTAVQNTLFTKLAPPYIGTVSEANEFGQILEVQPNTPEQRAYDMGVHRSAREIEWRKGDDNQKIVATIKNMEGFETQNGNRPTQEVNGPYFYAEQDLNTAGLFHIITGEYASDSQTHEENPRYTEFEKKLDETPIEKGMLDNIYSLYQKGIRMGILYEMTKNKTN